MNKPVDYFELASALVMRQVTHEALSPECTLNEAIRQGILDAAARPHKLDSCIEARIIEFLTNSEKSKEKV